VRFEFKKAIIPGIYSEGGGIVEAAIPQRLERLSLSWARAGVHRFAQAENLFSAKGAFSCQLAAARF
jgi:hypothetical protein